MTMGESHEAKNSRHQRLLNQRPIPPRHLQQLGRTPIPVRVRLDWEHAGIEHIDTEAVDWVGRDVLVRVDDERMHVGWVWVDAGDVERRPNPA